MLTSLHAGALGAGHTVRVACGADAEGGGVLGWTYLVPVDEGCATQEGAAWALLWLGVAAEARRAGVGAALLADAEQAARAAGGASLRICTTTQPEMAPARALYAKHGYAARGDAAPDYYGPGLHMIELWKQLRKRARPPS